MSLYQEEKNLLNKWVHLIEVGKERGMVLPNPGFATKAIHVGQAPEQVNGSINVPIYFSSTYAQKAPGLLYSKFDYSRAGNPTVDALNQCYAALEHGKYAVTFSSGCAAMTAILMMFKSNDHVISTDDVYGGTNRLLNRVFGPFLLKVSMIDLQTENLKKTVIPETRLLLIETPTNPLLKLADITEVCEFARKHNILTVVDNTFASPYLQNPLLLGADMVLHSCTKYLSGHSDVIAGTVITNNKEIAEKLKFNLKSLGGCISPFDAYILLRSVKTLKVRMQAHCQNTSAIVEYLKNNPKISKLYYPGLETHPNHLISKKQMRHPGAMLSFELVGNIDSAKVFLSQLKTFILAESLGGVESLIESPALMTHLSVPKEQREALGIGDSLLRLSIGIEDIEDLLSDLENAFNHI